MRYNMAVSKVDTYAMAIYWDPDDGVFVAEVPNLPGCMAHGKSRRAALTNIEAAIEVWTEVTREAGEPVPPTGTHSPPRQTW